MKLLKIQPEVHGEWIVAGILPDVVSSWRIKVYDTAFTSLTVTVGFMHHFTEMPDSEAETLIVVEALPLLKPGEMYFIPDTQWAVTLA